MQHYFCVHIVIATTLVSFEGVLVCAVLSPANAIQ